MKRKFFIWALSVLLAMPCVLHAEEVEIPLMMVIDVETDSVMLPRDGSGEMGSTPPRPYSFRATIDGNYLSVTKQDEAIPTAQATVVNATTGGIVLNQQFTTSVSQQISNAGVYVLHIETAGGALVGQFIVQ